MQHDATTILPNVQRARRLAPGVSGLELITTIAASALQRCAQGRQVATRAGGEGEGARCPSVSPGLLATR